MGARYWVSAVIAATVILAAFLYMLASRRNSTYYQLKPTFPGTSPVWDVGPMPKIYLNVENTVHYQLNSSVADAEWAALVPPNGGIVHVGPDRQPFMPSVFHQLRCLDILRQAYVTDAHNTLPKQITMCRANLRLEPVVDPFGVHAVNPWGKLTCSDWRVVYEAFDKNEADYEEWLKMASQ